MKKRISLVLALMMLLSLCSFARAEQEPLHIEFWHTRGSGANYDVLKNSVDTFNATIGKEKGIVVEESYIGDYVTLFSQIQLAVQSGEAPNIVSAANTYVAYMLEDDMLVDLAPYAEATASTSRAT